MALEALHGPWCKQPHNIKVRFLEMNTPNGKLVFKIFWNVNPNKLKYELVILLFSYI